ncbi:hypothetical protein ABRZ24_20220 [Brenneria populi]|uniref:Uncharacterized protein n=1 Tax=Brenneria populi TaxID=1505588 RepID=A0ABU6JVW0_9GAMM|nr:hypothetical protein [Brenneria populi Li et al. 2015]
MFFEPWLTMCWRDEYAVSIQIGLLFPSFFSIFLMACGFRTVTEMEIQQTLGREMEQERWTSLDRTLQREVAVFEPGDDGRSVIGRVAAKGLQ